jgi:hypothetical protein
MSIVAPPGVRDCLDCGEKDGMKLHNVAHTAPINIPLLYICQRCGTHPRLRRPRCGSRPRRSSRTTNALLPRHERL